MEIHFCSVFVTDQDKALQFYTEKLGFIKKSDIPMGQYRWLTVVSPTGPTDIELVLEPLGFPPAADFQNHLYKAGIPFTAFITQDIQSEYNRLASLGVVFRGKPERQGAITNVLFEDTCGNLINLVQPMDT